VTRFSDHAFPRARDVAGEDGTVTHIELGADMTAERWTFKFELDIPAEVDPSELGGIMGKAAHDAGVRVIYVHGECQALTAARSRRRFGNPFRRRPGGG
jgi:hypothetical protein